MKYEILKTFTVDGLKGSFTEHGIELFKGSIFTTFEESGIAIQDIIIPYKILIEQGFIEEVKETPKPRWNGKIIKLEIDGVEYTAILN